MKADRPNLLYTKLLLLLIVLLATPLYFVTTPEGVVFAPLLVFKPGMTIPGFGIPIALAGVPLVGGAWLLLAIQRRIRWADNRLPIVIALAVVVWMTAVAVLGVSTATRPVLTAALYAQTVLPLLVLVAVITAPLSETATRRTLLAIPIVGSASVMLLLLAGGYFLANYSPIQAFWLLAEPFYSAKNVHPVVVAIGIGVLLWQFSITKDDRDLDDWKLWTMLFIHAAYMLIIWSRSGLLMIVSLFGLWVVREVYVGLRGKLRESGFWRERAMVAGLMLIFGTLSVTSAGLAFRPVLASLEEPTAEERKEPGFAAEKPGSETDPEAPGGSPEPEPAETETEKARLVEEQRFGDNRRVRLVMGGVARVSAHPVVGVAFKPLPPGSVIFGREEREHKLYPSHNQYVDIAVRAGLPALLLYLCFLLTLAVRLWRVGRDRGRGSFRGELAMIALFILGSAGLGSMFQNYFVVSQPALLIFVVTGLALMEPRKGSETKELAG